MNRRTFLHGAAVGAATLALPKAARPAADKLGPVFDQIPEAARRVGGAAAGVDPPAVDRGREPRDVRGLRSDDPLLQDAGFDTAVRVPTDGQPGVFATLDAGAPRTIGLYFMYDVKQVDPAEWSSPPFEAAIVDKPGSRQGRRRPRRRQPEGAGSGLSRRAARLPRRRPQAAGQSRVRRRGRGGDRLAALPADRPPARGRGGAARAAAGVFMPNAVAGPRRRRDGHARRQGRRRVRADCERREVGPRADARTSTRATRRAVDSPAWHLVQALDTLVSADGNTPAIEGFAAEARPISPGREGDDRRGGAAPRRGDWRRSSSASTHWIDDVGWVEALERLVSQPTVNIEGLVGGYTGPGGKTILPHRAVAKLDLRLVPDMKAADALAALKAHLAKHGFGDIEVNMTGGYDPTSTPADAALIRAQVAVLQARRHRSGDVAAQRRLLAGLRLHGRAAAAGRRPLRPRPRQRRARARTSTTSSSRRTRRSRASTARCGRSSSTCTSSRSSS